MYDDERLAFTGDAHFSAWVNSQLRPPGVIGHREVSAG